MSAKKYKIAIPTLVSGATATTITIPITMEYQLVDQAELVDRVFVDTEVEKAINPILDYEKVRFIPQDSDVNGNVINDVTYKLEIGAATDFAGIGFTDDDIEFEKNSFKKTFINLSFYDSDNALEQNLVNNITIFTRLDDVDLLPNGKPKPASQIPLDFKVSSPILSPNGFSEGYHIYDYKDELKIGDSKYLYMRATFNNAKTGKSTNLMVGNVALPIDDLVNSLYVRYKLYRTDSGYYYTIDDTYSNNVTYPSPNVAVNLYEIKAT